MISTPEAYLKETNIRWEDNLTERIHNNIQRCQNSQLPNEERTKAWEGALQLTVNKRLVAKATLQALRPAEYHEQTIDKSLIDDRILEGYIPTLKHFVDSGQVDPTAAFGIVEFFLRTKYRNLNPEQTEALFRLFPPKNPQRLFKDYKVATEAAAQTALVPGMDPQQSWETRREVMDLMEIADLLNQSYLRGAYGKTIYISDLMKASALALRLVHQADSPAGVELIKQNDRSMARSTTETVRYRNLKRETTASLMKRPDLVLAFLLGTRPRNFQADTEALFSLGERVNVQGAENIPQTGSVIIAFSHLERWKDRSIPVGWEKAAMVQQVKQKRPDKGLSLIAYLNYYKETAPWMLRGVVDKLTRRVAFQLKRQYGVEVIDVNGYKLDNLKDFINQTQAALQREQAVLISPEGIPAPEVVKPKRGLGMLARMSKAPVVGVAFREDQIHNGSFNHTIIFRPPQYYRSERGVSNQEQDQRFAEMIMKDIASQLPPEQRGIYS